MMFDAHLSEPMDVGFARAEVSAFDRVVEEAPDRVAIVLIVLRRIDPALGSDRVSPPRAVLVAESTPR